MVGGYGMLTVSCVVSPLHRLCANKPADLRHIIPGIHVDQPNVLERERPRIVVAVAGEALVGLVRVVGRRRWDAVVAEGSIAGQRTANVGVAAAQRGHAAQMVGVGVVEHPGLRPYLRQESNNCYFPTNRQARIYSYLLLLQSADSLRVR